MSIKIYSSHGELTINEQGEVIECDCDNCDDNCIDNIAKVDVEEWKKYHNVTELPTDGIDILDLGYWTKDGRYDEPAHDWRQLIIEMNAEEN